jgi:hypothetical protein
MTSGRAVTTAVAVWRSERALVARNGCRSLATWV